MGICIKADEVKVHASISSIFHLADDGDTHFILAILLSELGTTFNASVRGYTFCQEKPDYITCPFKVTRTTGSTFIVGAIKIYQGHLYLVGAPAHIVKDFSSATDTANLFSSVKVTSESLLEVEELLDTETAKLKTNFDAMIQGNKLFTDAKLKDGSALEAHCEKKYEVNARATLTDREKRALKLSKERATTALDPKESAAGAKEAKEKAAAVKTAILSWAKYYDVPVLQRFITVPDDKREETLAGLEGQPNAEELKDALNEYCQMLDSAGEQINNAVTPFKEFLEKMPTPQQPPASAESAGRRSSRARTASAPRAVFPHPGEAPNPPSSGEIPPPGEMPPPAAPDEQGLGKRKSKNANQEKEAKAPRGSSGRGRGGGDGRGRGRPRKDAADDKAPHAL